MWLMLLVSVSKLTVFQCRVSNRNSYLCVIFFGCNNTTCRFSELAKQILHKNAPNSDLHVVTYHCLITEKQCLVLPSRWHNIAPRSAIDWNWQFNFIGTEISMMSHPINTVYVNLFRAPVTSFVRMRETCRRVCQKGNAVEERAVPLRDTTTG